MTTVLTAFTTGYELGRLWVGIVALVGGAVAIGFGIWLVRRRQQPLAMPVVDTMPADVTMPAEATAPAEADSNEHSWAPPAEFRPDEPSPGASRRTGGIVLVVAGVVLVAAGLLRTIPTLRDDLSRHTVTLPQTAGSLQQVQPSAQMQALLENVPNQLSNFGEITHVQAGAYAESGSTDPVAYLIVADVAGAPDPDSYFKGASSAFAQSNSGLVLKAVDTAGLPGQMRCAELPTSVGMCLWLDSDTLGVVIRGPGAAQSAVDVANTLRAAAES